MSALRKCQDCKRYINLGKEDYLTEKHGNRNICRHTECGKRLLDLPVAALVYHVIMLHIHFGAKCPIKSIMAHGLLIVNADFPSGVETECNSIGAVFASMNWGKTTPEERKEIENRFIKTFGGGMAV